MTVDFVLVKMCVGVMARLAAKAMKGIKKESFASL